MSGWFDWGDDRDSKRSLTLKQRKILYKNAKGRCQNPACNRKITFDEMQAGHKYRSWAKGGETSLRNAVCLCYRCNKKQNQDSWAIFLRKQGVVEPKTKLKQSLQKLKLPQLKRLANKHKIKLKGKTVETFFSSYRKAPTKTQYVNKLSGVVTLKEIASIPKEKVAKKKRRKATSYWW